MEVNETGAINIEQPRITKLIIEKDVNLNAENRDGNNIFTIKGISILRSETNPEGYDYYKLSDLSKTRRLSIVLRDKDEEREVELPEKMLQRMADYIANKNVLVEKEFDCVAFAHAANGIPYNGPDSYNSTNWEKTPFLDNLEPGDTIAIADSKLIGQEYKHLQYISEMDYIYQSLDIRMVH